MNANERREEKRRIDVEGGGGVGNTYARCTTTKLKRTFFSSSSSLFLSRWKIFNAEGEEEKNFKREEKRQRAAVASDFIF